jgi:hypothetical protein
MSFLMSANPSEKFKKSKMKALNPKTSDDQANSPEFRAAMVFDEFIIPAKDIFWDDINNHSDVRDRSYTENYISSHNFRGVGECNSWANVAPDEDIALQDVKKLNIENALVLAKVRDGDIDGFTNNATSSVKEGDESFTVGASYSGTRGVNISEVSGLKATYIRGKKVSWLDGDSWTKNTGGDYHSESTVKEMSSKVVANKITKNSLSYGKIIEFNHATLEYKKLRKSGVAINTVNMAPGINELNLFAECVKTNVGAVVASVNFAGVAMSYGFSALKNDLALSVYDRSYKKVAILQSQITDTPVRIGVVSGFDVMVCKAEALLADKVLKIVDAKLESINADITKSNNKIENIKNSIATRKTDVSDDGAVIKRSKSSIQKSHFGLEEKGTVLVKQRTFSEKTTFSVKSKQFSIENG